MRRRATLRARRLLTSGAALLALGGCAGAPSALDPAGPGARPIAGLGWLMFAVATLVVLFVIGVLRYGLFRPRRDDSVPGIFRGYRLMVGAGILMRSLTVAVERVCKQIALRRLSQGE